MTSIFLKSQMKGFSNIRLFYAPTLRLNCGLGILLLMISLSVQAGEWRVCPDGNEDSRCPFKGYSGLQMAIDQARDGDRVILSTGIYQPQDFRDVPYKELVIRGGVLIEGKTLQLVGEVGAILDGSVGPKVSALLVSNSKVDIQNLEIRNFRVDQAEDDLYEGHGIFIINSEVTVKDTVLRQIPKMSLSIFGNSQVKLSRIQVLNGHVGIWMEGDSRLSVENSLFSHNDSAALAAYDQTHSEIYNSVIDSSLDDGIYAKEHATIVLKNSILVNNSPYAIRVEEEASIEFDYTAFHGNEALFFPESASPNLVRGEHIFLEDPALDSGYRTGSSFQLSRGDPAIRNRDGSVSDLGLFGGPGAPDSSVNPDS